MRASIEECLRILFLWIKEKILLMMMIHWHSRIFVSLTVETSNIVALLPMAIVLNERVGGML
jgi:hypothetical protein